MWSLTLLVTVTIVSAISADCPNIISRSKWGGKPAKEVLYQTVPVKYVVIAHTATAECTDFYSCADIVESIRAYNMDTNNWHDIAFNFLIGGDGNVYEGAGWHKLGSHTYGYNRNGVGIAFIGNFERSLPNEWQLNATRRLLDCGVETLELDRRYRLIAQRQVIATVSPGLPILQEIQKWPHWVSQA